MDTIMTTQTPTSNSFHLNGVAMAAMLLGLGWILYQGLLLGLTESTSSTYLAVGLIAGGFVWQVLVFMVRAIESSVTTYRISNDGHESGSFAGITESDSHFANTETDCSSDSWNNHSSTASFDDDENLLINMLDNKYVFGICDSTHDALNDINPTTGLPMMGGFDTGGNFYGEFNS